MIGMQGDYDKHFETLDLLRGIAAICVVFYHFSSRVEYGSIFYHGYLAVDFFFCLSGYVIFQAYHHKLSSKKISIWRFFVIRTIRFLPLVLLGNFIAAITDLYRPGTYGFCVHILDIAIVLLLSCFLLPTPFETTLEQTTYPLNGPVWSLFFELIANIIFAALARTRCFWSIVLCIWSISMFFLFHVSFLKGDIHVGPHIEFFLYAFPRVFFSFFLGVLLHKTKFKIRTLNQSMCCLVIICIFSVPEIQHMKFSAAFDLIAVTILFPFVVFSGANRSDETFSTLPKRSGELSYPLYAVHYPLVRSFAFLMRNHHFPVTINVFISIIMTALMSVLSLILFRFYDKPFRSMINSYLKSKSGKID